MKDSGELDCLKTSSNEICLEDIQLFYNGDIS